ncbi:phage tail fiber protein [Pantoea piersonii]|uniref:phage tail fiber protein n=2 Tax=Pantoea piersonii TaxID=2364647 RepID=UPI0028AE3F19|nr:phage tail protein [Pantoea piersonii]
MPAGTITLTNNSTSVTGSGTSFTTELKANDFIVAVVGGVTYTLGVKSVDSAAGLTLITAYNGPTASGLAWTAMPNAALVGITAQVAADVAKAIRGLNLDKVNWQQIFSSSSSVTVSLTDGSNFTGPGWGYLSSQLATKTANQVLTDGSGNNWYGFFSSRTDFGMMNYGDTQNIVSPWDAPSKYSTVNYFPSPANNIGTAIASGWGSDNEYYLNSKNSAVSGYQGWKGWARLWHSKNTTVDSNGFIKRASPIVKLFSDGTCEINEQAEGVTSERISEGVYRITGTQGFNSDASWGGPDGGIGLPKDRNDQTLLWVDYEVGVSGDLLIKTFHREHKSAPKFARNEVEGYEDGAPIDIPAGRWVDLRVEVYSKDASPVEIPETADEAQSQPGS